MKPLAERLAAQNSGHSWLSCDAHGLKCRPVADPAISITVDGYLYEACSRCPSVRRRAVPMAVVLELRAPVRVPSFVDSLTAAVSA